MNSIWSFSIKAFWIKNTTSALGTLTSIPRVPYLNCTNLTETIKLMYMQIAFPINGEGFRFLFRRNNLIQMSRSGTLRNFNPRFKSNYFHSKRMFVYVHMEMHLRKNGKENEGKKGRFASISNCLFAYIFSFVLKKYI